MPIQAWAHEAYWGQDQSTVVIPPPPPVISKGGYPGWQASVILPSMFGAIGAWIDGWVAWYRAWRDIYDRVNRLPRNRRMLLWHVLTVLESPEYDHAKTAVRLTATTLGFNRPEAWKDYGRALKDDARRAENVFRHIRATQLLQESFAQAESSTNSRLTNPEKDLLAQLAYQEYAMYPWR